MRKWGAYRSNRDTFSPSLLPLQSVSCVVVHAYAVLRSEQFFLDIRGMESVVAPTDTSSTVVAKSILCTTIKMQGF